jgi:5'-methylthioadenosine phosphorylase
MGRLALVVGTSLGRDATAARGERRVLRGVELVDAGDHLVLYRHGHAAHVPPHRIDHAANLLALREAGADRVLAFGSTGSLRLDWEVGTVVAPDDFYAPSVNPTIHHDEMAHSMPGFDRPWRARVLEHWRAATPTPILDGGVYAQTTGPRFETPAEIRALARVADVVGMTIAAECIVAKEVGLAYAAVCIVDNLGNGLKPEGLTVEEFREGVRSNHERLVRDLDLVVPGLAGEAAA